jgi:hypothetical protein
MIAFVATVAAGYVLSGVSAPLAQKTGFGLVDLQFSGWYPIVSRVPSERWSINRALAAIGYEAHPDEMILEAWRTGCLPSRSETAADCRREDLRPTARRAQKVDFVFAAAYGVFALLLGVAVWRGQPEYPLEVRWVWLIALGALAALLDEVENLRIWSILNGTARVTFLLPTAVASVKVVLLVLAVVGLIGGLLRAHQASEAGEPES